MMQLLEDCPSEVYNAYFPRNIVASNNLSFREAGSSISTNSVFPAYFPRGENIVCAEDPEWDRGVKGSGIQPPRLSTRCVQVLAKYFSHKPNSGSSLKGGDRARFLVQLSTREPLLLTVDRIPDEIYWKRCCQEQLTASYDVALHGGSWKRMYLERHLQRFIEKYVPLQTDMFDIKEILPTLEPFVKRLQVDELLAPTVYMLPGQESADLEDNSEESDDDGRDTEFGRSDRPTSDSRVGGQMILEAQPEINMKVPANHFDFGAILPMLSNLEEVYVCYKVKKCGTDFRWNMFGMTVKDADALGSGLRVCKKLRVVKISNSKMDDDRFYTIYDGIKNLNHLEKLNFANNDITDESIDAIVKLLSGTSKIKYLDLTNNKIGCEGAKQLSTFISSAPKGGLETLILSLNNLKEDGCGAMCKAVGLNKTIVTLDLSSNRLDKTSCPHLRDMLRMSSKLENLNVACNQLGQDGGKILLEGVKMSRAIKRVDVRLTGCGRDVDLSIQEILRKNKSMGIGHKGTT